MMRIPIIALEIVCLVALGWFATHLATSSGNGATSTAESKIKWRQWDNATFAEAKAGEKLVLLLLSPSWCSSCSEMERNALGNAANAELINQKYLPIRVDPDRRPDIYDRYHLGGYPSCVIMTAEGLTLGGSLYLPADSLNKLLTDIDRVWMTNKPMVKAQVEKLHSLFVGAAHERKPGPPSELGPVMAEDVVKRLYDSTYGGFGTQPKFILPDVNDYLFGAVAPNGGPMFREQILKTLDAQLALLDTVWGGFYRYASFADWSGHNCEKLLELNARTLSNYLDAYLLTGSDKYRKAAELTIGYLNRFLKTDQGWGFYNSQQGAILAQGKPVDPVAYFSGTNDQRLKYGAPAVDKAIYVASNGYAVSAYFKAKRVLGRQDCADYASATLNAICEKAAGSEGGIYHEISRTTDSPFGLLADQIACITALLDGYETLGTRQYLTQAERIARFVSTRLLDTATGGFDYEPPAPEAIGRMGVVFRPYGFNCDAVAAFTRLSQMTSDTTYRALADRVLRSLFNTPIRDDDLRLCKLASAYLWLYREPARFVFIAKPGADYQELLQVVWKNYYPRLVLVRLEVGRDKLQVDDLTFPSPAKPSLFVCQQNRVSPPIDNPATAIGKIRDFLRSSAQPDTISKAKQ
jgi:hypothetical protein